MSFTGRTGDEELAHTLRVLQKIGSQEAKELSKRTADFYREYLNLRQRKAVEKILKSIE